MGRLARALAIAAAGLMAAAGVGASGCGKRILTPYGPRDGGAGAGGAGGLGGRLADASDAPGAGGARSDAAPDIMIADCAFEPAGYASVGENLSGGGGGVKVYPTTQAELQMYADMDAPLVIVIDGVITIAAKTQVDFNKPYKTVRGLGSSSGFTGGGLRVKNAGNVIFQNLVFTNAVGTDCITLETAHHVWIDHCDFSGDPAMPAETFDSLIDITHGSQNITVSWSRFHDHPREASFVGNGDNFGPEDVAITATFHHNYFNKTRGQNPSLRFGTVHAYNNYLKDISMIGMSARLGGKLLASNNYFDTMATSITTRPDTAVSDGFLQESMNRYVNTPTPVNPQTTTTITVPYVIRLGPVDEVPVEVLSCAGTGKPGLPPL